MELPDVVNVPSKSQTSILFSFCSAFQTFFTVYSAPPHFSLPYNTAYDALILVPIRIVPDTLPAVWVLCKDGDSHGIENIGDTPLEFMALILYSK